MKKYYYMSLLTGFYNVCVEKGFRDGFLTLCSKENIPLRRIQPCGEKIFFCVPCGFYERLCTIAAESGCEIKITGSFGVLPFVKKHRNRAFLLSGIIFTLLFIAFSGMRIWSVSVKGCDGVFESEILSESEAFGLKPGVKKSRIDVTTFQKELLEKMSDKLIWVSLNIEGMCAEIEVREVNIPQYDILGKPCNIIADFDGVINVIRTYSGTPFVRRGDGVHKGDLLISGVTEYETGETSFDEARGKITATHSVKLSREKEKSIRVRKYTDIRTYYSLSLFGFEINPFFGEGESCEITKEEKYLEINGVRLPFFACKYTVSNYEEESLSDEKILSEKCRSDYLFLVREKLKNSTVLKLSAKKCDGFAEKYEVVDYIGQKSVILLENE